MTTTTIAKWTEYGRNDERPRHIEIRDDNTATITIKNVVYWRILGNPPDDIEAIDPDGGPYYRVGHLFNCNDMAFTIDKILGYEAHMTDEEEQEYTLVVQVHYVDNS